MKPPLHFAALLSLSSLAVGESIPYSIGEPTNEEQYYLELINRARADPEAEGILIASTLDPQILYAIDFFNVDLDLFKSEMADIAPLPPLAMNQQLVASARAHSEDMFIMGRQTHEGSDGSSWVERGVAFDYNGSLLIENIYASSAFTEFGHAAFEIDWGPGGSGGMLPGRAHRFGIHYQPIREAGIGIFNGSKSVDGNTLGPQLVTQDFGSGPRNTAFITGVVYHDLNENHFYDPGEGVGGIEVIANDGSYSGITAGSGGYSVPVPRDDATYDLEFIGPGVRSAMIATISGGANVKVDLILDYTAPEVSGSTVPAVGIPATYRISPVPGASSYDWRMVEEAPVEHDQAENLNRVTPTGSANNSMISSSVKYRGAHAYHLFHDDFSDRALTYDSTFQVGAEAAISFRSRLVLSLPNEIAKVQVSENEGQSWDTIWSQAGDGGAGEAGFQLRSVSLGAYAGKEVRLRFLYDYTSGSLYPYPVGQPIGWYVDQIEFTDMTTASVEAVSSTGEDRTFKFKADDLGQYRLSARPVFSGRAGAFGSSLPVEASAQNSYRDWALAHEQASGLPSGSLADDPEGDLNGDGIANVMSYALGLEPNASASDQLPQPYFEGGHVVVDYTDHPLKTDLQWVVEFSSALETWSLPGEPGAPTNFLDEVLFSDGDTVTRRASLPINSGEQGYLRLRAALK